MFYCYNSVVFCVSLVCCGGLVYGTGLRAVLVSVLDCLLLVLGILRYGVVVDFDVWVNELCDGVSFNGGWYRCYTYVDCWY